MRKLLTLLFVATAGIAFTQQMPSHKIPAAELAKAKFMLGHHKCGKLNTMMDPSGKATIGTSVSSTALTMGGAYIEQSETMMMGGVTMHGKLMLSYDTMQKKWVGWWFDSSYPMVMSFSGNFQGKSLVCTSDPATMPGMEGTMVMRVTYTPTSATSYDFSLKMQQGETWAPMISGNFKKS